MICKVANACFCLVKAANWSVKESAGTGSVRERDNNTSLGPSEAKVSARTDGAPRSERDVAADWTLIIFDPRFYL